MSQAQKQELNVFNDHTVISKFLFEGSTHSMITVTDRAATSSSWLMCALVETLIIGYPASIQEPSVNPSSGFCSGVTIASFINNNELLVNSFNKLKIPSQKYKVLDCFDSLVSKYMGRPTDVILDSCLKMFPMAKCSAIILEKPEILMSLFGMSSDEVHLRFINPLLKRCSVLIVLTSVESFDNDMPESIGKDTVEFNRFAVTCLQKSIALLNLKPLDTGKAKDVTGTLTVARGGVSLHKETLQVTENEYLYYSQRESTTLFYR